MAVALTVEPAYPINACGIVPSPAERPNQCAVASVALPINPLAPDWLWATREPKAAYAIRSAISAPAQCRASMAIKSERGKVLHMASACHAATQVDPIFCSNCVSSSTNCENWPWYKKKAPHANTRALGKRLNNANRSPELKLFFPTTAGQGEGRPRPDDAKKQRTSLPNPRRARQSTLCAKSTYLSTQDYNREKMTTHSHHMSPEHDLQKRHLGKAGNCLHTIYQATQSRCLTPP